MRSRTIRATSTYVSVEISPATTTRPVVISVSQATRPLTSSVSTASSTESEIWSATLSGCPAVTDSDVKRKSRPATAENLLDRQEPGDGRPLPVLLRVQDRGFERPGVRPRVRSHRAGRALLGEVEDV